MQQKNYMLGSMIICSILGALVGLVFGSAGLGSVIGAASGVAIGSSISGNHNQ
jgi:uncharacterized membrane protein